MPKWKKEGIFVRPLFRMKCLGCRDSNARFIEVGYGLSNFPIDDDYPEKYDSYVIDRTYRCNLCGWQQTFGVALSKEHFEEILDYEARNERGKQETTRYLEVH